MFRRGLKPGEALLLVEKTDSRAAAAIHMLFVPFDLAVVWINSAGRVVDMVQARPWRPFYGPSAPARYILETHPDFLDKINRDEEVAFETA
jgi:uncharacterized membrane protein (UPF0127 family)